MTTRRSMLTALAATTALVAGFSLTSLAEAADAVKVALIAPMSGPWARQGELMKIGAELAIKDINAAGGIKSLGGAPMELVVVDAGDSTEKAKNAAQRMVSEYPDLVGVTGAWLSSFTLSVSEVTERAGIPMLTVSYSDQITSRGFKYIFQTAPAASRMVGESMPSLMQLAESVTGKKPATTGMITDNTAASVAFATPMREKVLPALGVTVKFDEVFTPPLSDATSLVQQARSQRPDFLIMAGSNVPDAKLLLEKFREFGLNGKMPVVSNGGAMGAPALLKNVGPDLLENLMSVVANWGHKGQEELIARFVKETGEPWMTQDSISTYGDMQVFAYALEKAGKADKEAVAEAIRAIDVTDGPAVYYSGERLKFDEQGRNTDAKLVIIQWQNGVPVAVFPPAAALAAPIWTK